MQVFRMRNCSQKVYKISVQLQNNKTSGKTLNPEVHYEAQKYCLVSWCVQLILKFLFKN